jgi:hypothetical protein
LRVRPAQLAAVVALDRLLMIPALFHSRPSSSSTSASDFNCRRVCT